MRSILTTLFATLTIIAFGQGNANAVLRQQTFGVYSSIPDLKSYPLDTNTLVVFSNGYVLTKEEFQTVFHATGADTTGISKTKYLDKLIDSYQKCFEAMDQNMDTSTRFQLDYLKYKQEVITPWLNEGYSRVDAEAHPDVKYVLRKYYTDKLVQRLLAKEVWSKANDEGDQKTFFYAHPELYQGQPFEISKTKVVFDYQKELETALNERVQKKFDFAKNEKLVIQL